ncbi:helix-turn-helix domain-containing protein [Tsukamurella sp. 1534]|uniref:helix-turn-helix domain-containing protein n=1 Tax=Tsukamurella sp. 1534 TaxID=1151061 RepID=UPI0002F92BDB|nr:XRE family transcriptional regulator [Tsukamurella sp. 1534]
MTADHRDASWIGRRTADLRRARGRTLADLAAEVGLSVTQLSRIETGARQPSVGTLLEIAHAFGIPLSELVAEPRHEPYHLVRAGERRTSVTASGTVASLSGGYPGVQAVHLTLDAAAEAPEARHDGEEWVYVLSGSVSARIGADELVLSVGDAIHFPSHTTHSLRNFATDAADLLIVVSQTLR